MNLHLTTKNRNESLTYKLNDYVLKTEKWGKLGHGNFIYP